jgi:intein/homing endonuclease
MDPSKELEALLLEAEGYESLPVGIDTFLEDEAYFGDVTKGGTQIYPIVRKELRTIFPNAIAPSPYFKVFLKGCFTGDTTIPLLDGTEVSFEELEKSYEDKKFWVYSRNSDGEVVPGLAHSPRVSKYVDELVRVTLNDGEEITCTPDHPYELLDGTYKEAQYLESSDSLMPLYRRYTKEGYELVKSRDEYELTSWIVLRGVLRIPLSFEDHVCHHKNRNKRDNRPENLQYITKTEHSRLHTVDSILRRWFDPELREEAINIASERMTERNTDPEYKKLVKEGLLNSDKFKEANRKKIITYNKSEKGRSESRKRAAHMRGLLKSKSDVERRIIKLKQSLGSIKKNCKYYCGDVPPWKCSKYGDRYLEVLEEIRKVDPTYNHYAVKVERFHLDEPIPVYDITVDKYHNFALSAGVFVHNSIGWGKTTLAKLAQAYNIYRLTLMKDPHEFYGLLNTTHIAFLCFSATLDLAGETYDEFLDLIGGSPYFKDIAATNDKEGRLVKFPKKIIVKPASTVTHTLGAAVLGGILDEMNFHRAGVTGTYNAYASVLRRMGSRFEKDGYIAGQLYTISSETDISSFMEKVVSDWRYKPGVLVRAHSVYSTGKRKYKDKFKVYVGDGIKPPRILQSTKEITQDIEDYIIDVPLVYKPDFETNIYDALRDISGIPATSRRRFYPTMKSILDVAVLPNVFYGDTVSLPFKGEESLLDHCDLDMLGKLDKKRPRNIHIDIASSGTGDRLGLGSSYFRSYKRVTRTKLETGESYIANEPFMVTDMAVGVEAVPGYEIPLFKVMEFIIALIKHGYNIYEVTADGYQSTYLLQILKRKDIKARVISCDKTDYAPVTLKHGILERRCVLPKNALLIKELSTLIREKNKIDHPEESSKDIADGVTGSYVGAIENIQNIPVALQTATEEYELESETIYDKLRSMGGKVYH